MGTSQHGCGLTSHPDFVPSLRLLIEREKYSLTDIGLMFNVSRERVRQWCEKHEIRHPRSSVGLLVVRFWDEGENRFNPVSRSKVLKESKRKRNELRKSVLTERIAKRRHEILEVAIKLKAELNRDPTIHEITECFFGEKRKSKSQAGRVLAAAWSGGKTTRSRYQALRAALKEVGVFARSPGVWGHVDSSVFLSTAKVQRERKMKYCNRGHDMDITRNKYSQCQECVDWRTSVRKARLLGKPIPPEPLGVGISRERATHK